MMAVIIKTRAVFQRRRDPDRAEAKIADIVQTLDPTLEIPTPVRIDRVALRQIQ